MLSLMPMKKSLAMMLFLITTQTAWCQDVRIYHGEKSESVFLKSHEKLENSSRIPVRIVRGVDGIVTIDILNPNPFFYNYAIKTEDVEIKDDFSDQFAELINLINSLPDLAIPASNPFAGRLPRGRTTTTFDTYQTYIQQVDNDLKRAKGYIEQSDRPETVEEALRRVANSSGNGFRAAVDNIKALPGTTGHFNSKSLEKDLNDILESSIADGSFATALNISGSAPLQSLFKSAFIGLNTRLVTTVNDILKIIEKDRIIRFQVPVKENKQTKVQLIITKINEEDIVGRELLKEEVATVFPLYVRKRFEVVPVVNLVFQSDRAKFAIEDGVIKSLPDDDAKFNIGAMALMNFASFGDYREYGVGFGLGYSIQPGGKASSFFAIPSLSYKDIFRVGVGFGYNLSPVGLKNGAEVGDPLPADVANIEDLIEYKRKPAAVISIAIAGIKF
jgi:hypothetical protein